MESKSKRIVQALLQLEQFTDGGLPSKQNAIHMLTGVTVSASPTVGDNEAIISVQFPGGAAVEVPGTAYLKLQIAESAAHEIHLDENSASPIALRSHELLKQLTHEHDL